LKWFKYFSQFDETNFDNEEDVRLFKNAKDFFADKNFEEIFGTPGFIKEKVFIILYFFQNYGKFL